MKLLKHVSTLLFFTLFSETAFAQRPIECLLNVNVIASQKYLSPQTEYTTIKNDGYPMLLIGITILDAKAIRSSQKIKTHNSFCTALIGQQRDAYLSGPYNSNNITIKIGDQLTLRNIHSSGHVYPFWPDFYYVEY